TVRSTFSSGRGRRRERKPTGCRPTRRAGSSSWRASMHRSRSFSTRSGDCWTWRRLRRSEDHSVRDEVRSPTRRANFVGQTNQGNAGSVLLVGRGRGRLLLVGAGENGKSQGWGVVGRGEKAQCPRPQPVPFPHATPTARVCGKKLPARNTRICSARRSA